MQLLQCVSNHKKTFIILLKHNNKIRLIIDRTNVFYVKYNNTQITEM